jgi:prevent-host-death family protein
MVTLRYEMTMSSWTVAAAKARFSALVAGARRRPQRITKRGRPVAVVMGVDHYQRVSGRAERAPHPMAAFLSLTDRMRRAGGLELKPPRRRVGGPRPSPFAGSD